MSTTLTKEEVTSDELEAWLSGEIEKTCELRHIFRGLCGRPANWVMFYKHPCGHNPRSQCFICDRCYTLAIRTPEDIRCSESSCSDSLLIKFIERIR